MKFLLLPRTDRWRWCRTVCFLLAALLTGCGKEEIKVYKVPKETAENVWNAPLTWQEVPPTQMLVAKFLATGDAGTKAEITISAFPGDVGGLLANVNRWRNQIGLTPVGQAELEKLLSPLDVTSGKAMLVDMTGNKSSDGKSTRLIGAIVPQAERTWFYKMLGDDSVVAREKEAFIKFVQTAKSPDGP